ASQYLRQVEANYYRVRGDYRRATRSAKRALQAALQERDQVGLGWATRELALAHVGTSRWARAEAMVRGALVGHGGITPLARSMLYLVRGRALTRARKIQEAQAEHARARDLMEGHNWAYAEAQARQLDAELAFAERRWSEGRAAAIDALEKFRALEAAPDRAAAMLEFARLARGAPSESQVPWRMWLQEAAAAFKRLGSIS